MIPMIRITEMYYIAAECRMEAGPDYDKSKALDYLNTVRRHRGIGAGTDRGGQPRLGRASVTS